MCEHRKAMYPHSDERFRFSLISRMRIAVFWGCGNENELTLIYLRMRISNVLIKVMILSTILKQKSYEVARTCFKLCFPQPTLSISVQRVVTMCYKRLLQCVPRWGAPVGQGSVLTVYYSKVNQLFVSPGGTVATKGTGGIIIVVKISHGKVSPLWPVY